MSARRFVVRGLVQGVNFRAAAAHQAQALRLTGRIWNRADGGVEAEAAGDPEALARFEAWLHRGPSHAQVESVDAEDIAGEPGYRGFAIG
jgi:acylphosphatase